MCERCVKPWKRPGLSSLRNGGGPAVRLVRAQHEKGGARNDGLQRRLGNIIPAESFEDDPKPMSLKELVGLAGGLAGFRVQLSPRSMARFISFYAIAINDGRIDNVATLNATASHESCIKTEPNVTYKDLLSGHAPPRKGLFGRDCAGAAAWNLPSLQRPPSRRDELILARRT